MPNDSASNATKLRYTFDLCFDEENTVDDEGDFDEEPEVPPPPPPPTFSEAELESAKAQAFKDGRDAGLNEAGSSIEQRAATALESIAGKIADFTQELERTNDATIRDFVVLTGQVLERVLPAYAGLHGTAEIEALASDCLAHLRTNGQVSVRVGAEMQPVLETRLQEAARAVGYAGEIVVEGDDSLAAGDASLSWSDGGAERCMETIWSEVDAAIGRAIHSLEAGPGAAAPAPEPATEQDPAVEPARAGPDQTPEPVGETPEGTAAAVATDVAAAAETDAPAPDTPGTEAEASAELPKEMAEQVTAVAQALEEIHQPAGGDEDVGATASDASEAQTTDAGATEPEGRD